MTETDIKPGYKMTKLGTIPEEWEIVKLGECGELLNGLTYSPKSIDSKGVLVLRSSNVQKGRISFLDNVFVLVEDGDYNPVLENDILICVRNGSKKLIGKSALIPIGCQGMAFGAFMSLFRSEQNKYLKHVFDSIYFKKEVHRNLGATINSINGGNLKKFKIPLPPLPEQKKIAQILSTWDQSIEKTQSLIQKMQLRKKGLMQQLLTGDKRLPGFNGVWNYAKASDIFVNHTDKSHNGDLEVLSATQEHGVIPRSQTGIDIKYDPASLKNYKRINEGDFIISLRSFQGGIEYSVYDGLVSPAYTVLKNKVEISKKFYECYLKTETFIKRLNSIIYGIRDGKQISYKDFGTLKIHYPPIKEQIAIAQVLTQADEEIQQTKNYLAQLQQQKKGLMQQLLTGQKRVAI